MRNPMQNQPKVQLPLQMKSMVHECKFPQGASYGIRENIINQDLVAIQSTLRSRGFYMMGHEIRSKTNTKATIVVNYH
jgi:hypothetical protein